METKESARSGYERRDLDPRAIALFGAALAAVIGAVVALSALLLMYASARYAERQVPRFPPALAREPTPEPRLRVGGAKVLREMREAEERVLNSYAWIDREAGIVRIPIERAIEMLAKKEGERKIR